MDRDAAERADYASLGEGDCVALDALGNAASATAQCSSRNITTEAMCRHQCDWLEACIGYTWSAGGARRLWFLLFDAPLPTMAASIITVRAECILYGGFGTFDGMVELRTSLSQHNLNWQCTEGSTVTSSNRRPGGPRCWLKGVHAVCLCSIMDSRERLERTVANRMECA